MVALDLPPKTLEIVLMSDLSLTSHCRRSENVKRDVIRASYFDLCGSTEKSSEVLGYRGKQQLPLEMCHVQVDHINSL